MPCKICLQKCSYAKVVWYQYFQIYCSSRFLVNIGHTSPPSSHVFYIAFEKRVMYHGQEYLTQLVDTAGQVNGEKNTREMRSNL